MFVHKLGFIKPRQTQLCPKLWAFLMKISLGPFLYFGQLLSGLSLIVGFFKNSGIVIIFSWVFQYLEVDKARNAPIFLLVWDGLLGQRFLGFFSIRKTNVETATLKTLSLSYWVGLFWKHGSVATSVQEVGLFLKTRLCCHLCLESGLISENSPLFPPLSRKWVSFWKVTSVATSLFKQMVYFSEVWRHENLGFKLNLGTDKLDNDVAAATSVQKVGLINFLDGLFL